MGWWRCRGAPLLARPARLLGKTTQGSIIPLLLTTGRGASTLLLAAGQGANGAAVHPGDLKGKFSP